MLVGTGILYLLFSNSDLQTWNTPNKENTNESELVPMKKEEKQKENERK